MIDPINASQSIKELPYYTGVPAKEDLHAAEAEVASLYYQSSIASLATPKVNQDQMEAKHDGANKAAEKSLLGRAKDWLWGIFGWSQPQPLSDIEAENVDHFEKIADEHDLAGGVPRLQAPEVSDRKRLSQSIADLNRDLVIRLKDMAEFEEEMKKGSAAKLDKFIFLQLINSSINQKNLKHASSNIAQEDIMHLHKKNQKLQKAHFDILDAVNSDNKIRGILKWVNVGLTAVAVGGTAIGFAFGGPVGIIAVGTPLSFLGKGASMLTDGILKYKNDGRTGNIVILRQQSKTNTEKKKDKLSDMQNTDSDIGALIKKIRHHLDNQTKAERASFGR
ncbi:MAG TPA: hypothetical protein VGP47_02755 [Parachlamydiaceae bacterium]|nr:hypothetical protein [Parachlamydiaceae bacterium]